MIITKVEIVHKQDFSEQGFYSKTYLAFDRRLQREIAVKDILVKNLLSNEAFEQHFHEALKLSVASHARILPVHYVGIDHNDGGVQIARIVTTYLKNGSLNQYVKKVYAGGRTLGLDEVVRFANDIVQGMIHLHSLDILHLDLKASNIYIADDWRLVLADFGQAKFFQNANIMKAQLYPAIAPIEHYQQKGVDKIADIYQFGLLLYSMVAYHSYRNALETEFQISTPDLIARFKNDTITSADKEAFKARMKSFTDAIKQGRFPKRDSIAHYIPEGLIKIIFKCVDPEITKRYNNFYEVQDDLTDIVFPVDVTDLHHNLTDVNHLYFRKNGVPCEIAVVPNGTKFDVSVKKNRRQVNEHAEAGVTGTKLQKHLFSIMSKL